MAVNSGRDGDDDEDDEQRTTKKLPWSLVFINFHSRWGRGKSLFLQDQQHFICPYKKGTEKTSEELLK